MNSTSSDDDGHEFDFDYSYSYSYWYSHLASAVSANVVSIIGFGISILLLCTHLIVYSITEEMWTLTGHSLASFCFSLLLSHCAYVAGMMVRDTNSPCAIVASLAFYFFLANSSWLLSISLQLYHTAADADAAPTPAPARQSRLGRNDDDSGVRRPRRDCAYAFVRYSAFSWTEPALILGAALYVEKFAGGNGGGSFKPTKNLRVDMFPLETNCFNIDTRMLIWFLVVFNVNLMAAFAISAFAAFVAHPNSGGGGGGGDDGGDNLVSANGHFLTVLQYYMRLSLLAGFVWIVGVCMIYFKGHVLLQIVFAVSNDALALYIFLVFTFNNRLSSVAFEGDKSYHMETFRKHSFQYGDGGGGGGGGDHLTVTAITSDV